MVDNSTCIFKTTLYTGLTVFVYEIKKQYYICWASDNEFGIKNYTSMRYVRKFLKKKFGLEVEI